MVDVRCHHSWCPGSESLSHKPTNTTGGHNIVCCFTIQCGTPSRALGFLLVTPITLGFMLCLESYWTWHIHIHCFMASVTPCQVLQFGSKCFERGCPLYLAWSGVCLNHSPPVNFKDYHPFFRNGVCFFHFNIFCGVCFPASLLFCFAFLLFCFSAFCFFASLLLHCSASLLFAFLLFCFSLLLCFFASRPKPT